MKKDYILELRIGEIIFGIKIDVIRLIFDIETLEPAYFMPEYVIGITKYYQNVYPVICLQKVLGLEENNCKNPIGKTGVVLKIKDKIFAVLADEIIKIHEVTKEGEELVSFHKDKEIIVEEISPQFLDSKIEIPPFEEKKYHQEIKKAESEEEKEYLIIAVKNQLHAIDAQLIRKVETGRNLNEIISDNRIVTSTFIYKNQPVLVVNYCKLIAGEEGNPQELILLEENKKVVGLSVNEVIDFVPVPLNKITKIEGEKKLKGFFIYNEQVVSIVSDSLIKEMINKYGTHIVGEEDTQQKRKDITEIMMFSIGNKKMAIYMEDIYEVAEINDVHISSYPSTNPCIKGLLVYKNKSYYLVDYGGFLNENVEVNEDTKIIFLKDENLSVAFLVSQIDDVVSVEQNQINHILSTESFIKGSIILNNKIIEIINPRWIFNLCNKKEVLAENVS